MQFTSRLKRIRSLQIRGRGVTAAHSPATEHDCPKTIERRAVAPKSRNGKGSTPFDPTRPVNFGRNGGA
jgi:hypothetical protein